MHDLCLNGELLQRGVPQLKELPNQNGEQQTRYGQALRIQPEAPEIRRLSLDQLRTRLSESLLSFGLLQEQDASLLGVGEISNRELVRLHPSQV